MDLRRRDLLVGLPVGLVIGGLSACADDGTPAGDASGESLGSAGWVMSAEDADHDRTWMCWPSSGDIWGEDLADVQDAIVRIADAIAVYEPVTMLVRPEEAAAVGDLLGDIVELLEAPVDDLWARDTLPCFLTRASDGDRATLAAGHVRFNGWGGKQTHDGDATLAGLVAAHLGVELMDSGLTGEGGGLEVDGAGTVLASASSWVNDNRNPGRARADIGLALMSLLGAERVLWIDGLAGADITDGHVDTLARFVGDSTIVLDVPAFDDPDDPWVSVAARTREVVSAARTLSGGHYDIVEIVQPQTYRGDGDDFLATYMNFYVCNGAVIAPEFGDDNADAAARDVLEGLFPNRDVVMVNIDALAAGGGGIHCATQQQPETR